MAEATVNARSIVTIGGGAKMEFIDVAATNGDYIDSHMNRLDFAMAFPLTVGTLGISAAVGVDGTGTEVRRITIHDCGAAAIILAFGN